MPPSPPFDSLPNSDAFEALCFDLLEAEGFSEIVWRGPGADGGRDIEAVWHTPDPTGSSFRTKWYVEAKWYTDSLPFGEIEPKLLAATAARADYLLIITSSRVRNTAMDSVNEWLANRGYPLRVRYWIGHDVLRLAVKHQSIFRRHFPGTSPPAWGNAEAALAKLTSIAAGAQGRISWRIIQTLQWIATELGSAGLAPAKADVLVEELRILSSMLRAQELLTITAQEKPSYRITDVRASAQLAIACANRRAKEPLKIVKLDECQTVTSSSLLVATFFEILTNAALYSTSPTTSVSLVADTHHWILEVSNACPEIIPYTWPLHGYRSAEAKKRHPSGQGLGCWIAAEAAKLCNFRVWWSNDAGQWVARAQGAIS